MIKMDYILTLPDETLLKEVFLRLPVPDILKLCQVNWRFSRVCQDDLLWRVKTLQDYPAKYYLKPTELSWRDYYIYLYTIPTAKIYRNGDLIGTRKVLPLIDPTITETVTEVFLGRKNLIPIAIVHYPDQFIEKDTGNYSGVDKILRIPGNAGYNPGTVYSNLFSRESRYPIYGHWDRKGNLNVTYLDINNHIKTLPCLILDRAELVDLLQRFNLLPHLSENVSQDQLCQILTQQLTELNHIVLDQRE